MNDYSFNFLDFRTAFVRLYTVQSVVHDVKYHGALLDKLYRAVDIKLRKKPADNNQESAGNKTPHDRGETTK